MTVALATAIAQIFVGREVERRAAVKSAESDRRVSDLEDKTRTKTTSEQLFELFDRIDPQFRSAITRGALAFNATLRESDYATLKRIAANDGRIRLTPSTNTRMDNEGAIIQVQINIEPDVFA